MKIVVFGARGNLGQELVRAWRAAGHDVDALDREDLDVTDARAVSGRLAPGAYGAAFNAVAYNNVDGAEDPANKKLAWSLNADVPRVLADACRQAGTTLVHFSTDYVFDGTDPAGYAESATPRPLSAYGESKLAGERCVLDSWASAFVIRTSRLFGLPGSSAISKPSFVGIMLKLAAERPELAIIDEEYGCPTYTKDLAEATVRLLTEGYAPGIYHLVNGGPAVTWYGFAEEIFRAAGVTTPRHPVRATPRPAQRPPHAALLNTKFPPLRHRLQALEAFLGGKA